MITTEQAEAMPVLIENDGPGRRAKLRDIRPGDRFQFLDSEGFPKKYNGCRVILTASTGCVNGVVGITDATRQIDTR